MKCLKIYINRFSDDTVVAPILTHMNIGGNKKYVWGLLDESGTKFRIPMKKRFIIPLDLRLSFTIAPLLFQNDLLIHSK